MKMKTISYTKKEIFDMLSVIRTEIAQLDYDKERWIEKGWFDTDFKKKYKKRKKAIDRKLDFIEYRLIPKMKG